MSNIKEKVDENNEILFSASVNECIDKIIKIEGFIEQTLCTRSISTNGGNYLGDLYEVDIKGKTEKGEKEINIFIKKIRELENKSVLSQSDAHSREIMVYKEILPIYEELEKEVNIPEQNRFKHLKCYASNNEVLIFDNLGKQGYRTLDRMDVMSLEYAESMIEQVAKFHALSFALKQKRPRYYEEKVQGLHHIMNFNDNWKKFIAGIIQLASSYLDDEAKRLLEAATPRIVDGYTTYVLNSSMLLCHGDYRINNILLEDQDGQLSDVVPIDFQMIHVGHPLNDLMYLIFPSTDKKFRKEHLQTIKEHYYKSLANHLKYFDMDVENVYPRISFDADFKDRLFYGLVAAIMMFPILFRSDVVEEDSNFKTMASLAMSLHDSAGDRIRDVVDDFIKWGLL